MEIEVTVTQSEYRAILMWDDDGGAACNVIYRVILDMACGTPVKTQKPPGKSNPEQGGTGSLPKSDTASA
jgi:hypothetical protein